ncbi:hypothetical protein V493_08456, partial [Pseudogymnoascus sp. VKM F-4281 (FW-2241)]
RGAWGGQGDTREAPNTHSSSGWGDTSRNSTNQTGLGQGAETRATPNADASSVWVGTGTNAVGIGNNRTESRGNVMDANGGWGVNNGSSQAVWANTDIERNKRPSNQIAGNTAKKLKSYVLHELEQVRRRVEEWEAGWDEEREGEGVVERAVEGGGLVEKMVWQSEATFLVVWPMWVWGAAAGLGEIGGQSVIEEEGFGWAKPMAGHRMMSHKIKMTGKGKKRPSLKREGNGGSNDAEQTTPPPTTNATLRDSLKSDISLSNINIPVVGTHWLFETADINGIIQE